MKSLLNSVFALLALATLSIPALGADGSSLKPPAGSKVAIVVFEDLECPSCAHMYPLVWGAANAHHVPVLLRDFPLGPKHPWSLEAAIWARFFDTQSESLGNAFRGYIFSRQSAIDPTNLQQYVEKFAGDNHVALPFVRDPGDKLRAKVNADHDLGNRIGINQTPTVFVVSNTESQELQQADQLNQLIEDVQKRAGPATPVKTSATKSTKGHKKKT